MTKNLKWYVLWNTGSWGKQRHACMSRQLWAQFDHHTQNSSRFMGDKSKGRELKNHQLFKHKCEISFLWDTTCTVSLLSDTRINHKFCLMPVKWEKIKLDRHGLVPWFCLPVIHLELMLCYAQKCVLLSRVCSSVVILDMEDFIYRYALPALIQRNIL